MLNSTSFVSFVLAVCLLLMVTQAARPEAEIQFKPKITCIGVCPVPNCTVSWTSVVPPRLNVSSPISYNVFCCGDNNENYCSSPEKYKEELKALQCCRKSANQSGITLSCDVTDALGEIYKPHAYGLHMSPQVVLYTVFALTDGGNNTRAQYSKLYSFNLRFGCIFCTEPSNFTATVSSDHVRLSWGMPPRMACESFQFQVQYSLVPDGCSNDSIQSTVPVQLLPNQIHLRYSFKTKFHKDVVHSFLKPYREYLFRLTCDTFENKESSASLVRVRTLSSVSLVGPRNLQRGNVRYFKRKRNVTLTWEAPSASCPAKWNGRPVKFLLQYFSIHKSKNSTSPNVSKLRDVTIVNINPSSNSAVIGYLSRYQEYAVNLSMCTESGCGPVTETVIVAEPEPTRPVEIEAEKGTLLWVVVTASALTVAAVVVVVVVVNLVMCFRSRKPSLSEPGESTTQPQLSNRVFDIVPYARPSYSTMKPLTHVDGDYVEGARCPLEESESSLDSSSGTQSTESEVVVDTA